MSDIKIDACPICGGHSFSPLAAGQYMCTQCGYVVNGGSDSSQVPSSSSSSSDSLQESPLSTEEELSPEVNIDQTRCPRCGSVVDKGVNICPNCGHQLKQQFNENEQSQQKYAETLKEDKQQAEAKENYQGATQFDTPQTNNEDKLGIGAIIGLVFCIFILLVGIVGCSDETNSFIMRSIGFICLAAIFCVFKGTIKRKYAWWVFAASLVGFNFMVALSDPVDSSDSSDQEVEVQEVKKDEEARKKQEQKAEAERVAQEKQAEAMRIVNEKAEKEAFVGRYIYKYYYHGTNIELYFVITLKSDGTFTHEPSNDQTRSIVEMETLVDGKDYPSGGKWKVKETPAGKAAFLDFGSSWGEGSITPNQKVLEIDNMNGVRLKAQLLKD